MLLCMTLESLGLASSLANKISVQFFYFDEQEIYFFKKKRSLFAAVFISRNVDL